jgi:glycosyltransferase involved in cell wall biosynthesis
MRLAYVVTRSDTIGGYHVHVRDLAIELRRQGDEVVVVTGGAGPFTEELHDRNIPVRCAAHLVRPIGPAADVRALAELRAILAEVRPDVTSHHSAKARCLGGMAARSLGLPVLWTAHGWPFADGVPPARARLYRGIERAVARVADRIVTVSHYDRWLATELHVAPPSKLVTIHNGMPDLGTDYRAEPGRSPVRFVMIARFEPQKDHATLFEALAGLPRDPSWEVELIGDGPLQERGIELAARLGLSERVRFLGLRKDVAARLREAQAYLLISNWEGFPRSTLEAMRAGLPVVASDVGGAGEAITQGTTGFLVPRGDARQLRTRLLQLLESPQLRAEMGAAGRRAFERHFTLDRMFQETTAVYRELATRWPPRGARRTLRRVADRLTGGVDRLTGGVASAPDDMGPALVVAPGELRPVERDGSLTDDR